VKSSIEQEDSFHQPIGLKFQEESSVPDLLMFPSHHQGISRGINTTGNIGQVEVGETASVL
jgi:hypothetical protein